MHVDEANGGAYIIFFGLVRLLNCWLRSKLYFEKHKSVSHSSTIILLMNGLGLHWGLQFYREQIEANLYQICIKHFYGML